MDVEALVGLDARLGADAEYVKAAGGFRDAPANAPALCGLSVPCWERLPGGRNWRRLRQ